MADLSYTLDDLASILEGILRQHGPQVMQLLGQYLQQKTDPSISRYLKSKMGGGLKAVLTARPSTFRITGTPPNEVVSLAQGGPQQARKAQTATLRGYVDAVINAVNNANFKEISRALRLFGGVQTAALTDELSQVREIFSSPFHFCFPICGRPCISKIFISMLLGYIMCMKEISASIYSNFGRGNNLVSESQNFSTFSAFRSYLIRRRKDLNS
jgi:hypothetical protein